MSSRRVSLPVTLTTPRPLFSNRLSPPSPRSSRRNTLWENGTMQQTLKTHRRSLPGTPRNRSPRYRAFPHLDQYACSSSSSENSPRRPNRNRRSSRPNIASADSGFMETNNNVFGMDGIRNLKPMEGQLRSFDYKHGSLVDNGYELKGHGKPIARSRGESRRATCPEIYLYPETANPPRHVLLRMYGGRNVGKKTLAHQIHHVASSTTPDQTHVISSETEEAGSKTISFLLNGSEVKMEILLESTLESSPFADHLTMFIVVYSVDSRESFKRAANLLYRIFQTHNTSIVPVVLVGNKIDLKRNIVVSTLEGKSLAKIYKCSFVEVSALLSMNIGPMWAELIRQIQDPCEFKPKDHSWVHRLLVRGRHIAKSCEELVQRIIAA